MTATAPNAVLAGLLDPSSHRVDRRWVAAALVSSGLLHVGFAVSVAQIPERTHVTSSWAEMMVVSPPPPAPEVIPEPEPEPVAATPEPEPVPLPVVETPPPPVARPVQGLSNDSFLPGTGTGLNVRAGHTTAVRAGPETLTLDQADTPAAVALAAVTHPPKIRYKPTLDVPDAVRAGGLVGRVELLLSIDAEGLVTHIEVVESLSPEADAACVTALKKSRWKPADVEGTAVATIQVPYSCRFEQTPG